MKELKASESNSDDDKAQHILESATDVLHGLTALHAKVSDDDGLDPRRADWLSSSPLTA